MSALILRPSLFVVALSLTGCVRWTAPSITPVANGSCRSTALQWLAPDDPRERARLDTWCAGVGTPASHLISTGTPETVGMQDMTFVSWNVHVGSGDIRGFVNDLRKGVHTNGRPVRHFVLMLQEAVRTQGVPALPAGARGASRIAPHAPATPIDIVKVSAELGGLSLIYVPSMRNAESGDDPHEDRGSAILSTMPLSQAVAIELPGERQRRVVILAKAGPVWVAVVHLDALGGARRLRLFWTPWMRDVQMRSLASALPSGPLVIGADLNTWHGRDEIAARALGKLFGATPLSIDRHGLGLRVLDYMFFRAGPDRRAYYRQLANPYGSDHRPLVGWVE